MPPEITAGLMALAAAPPGIAPSTGPPLPEPLSASLFAAFLAQNGPPPPNAAPPKAEAQTVAADPFTNIKQALFNPLNTKNLKTMDTLPTLSFPPALKAKDKASELPLHPALTHQASADEKPADEKPADEKPADNKPAADTPSLALALPVQIAFVPPALSVLVPVAPPPPSAVPTSTVPTSTVPMPTVPMPAASVSTLAVSSMPSAVSVSPSFISVSPSFISPAAAAPVLPSRSDAPAPAGPPLPRTPALTAPNFAPPQYSQPPVPQAPAPQPITAKVSEGKPVPVAANPLPRVASPVQNAFPEPAPQAQIRPQEQHVPSLLSVSATALAIMPPVTVQAAAQSGATPAAARPSPEPSKPVPVKTDGKMVAAALRPAAEIADTSTRTPSMQTLTVTAKTAVPAAAPEPMLIPEKHTPEPDALVTADSSKSSPLFTLPAATDTAKIEIKPLSAADRTEIVRQTADRVGAMRLPEPGAAQQMSVQLHPKDWGRLQVSVTLTPSRDAGATRTVTAHIVAETPQVKAALQSGTNALHQALRASGLHLEHLTVSVKMPEVKPAAQSASADLSSGQGQSEKPGQPDGGFGQPNSSTSGFGTNGFGMGGSQNGRQSQPPVPMPAEPDADETPAASMPLRLSPGRIDTRA